MERALFHAKTHPIVFFWEILQTWFCSTHVAYKDEIEWFFVMMLRGMLMV